ncbi:hypothetical protein P4555_13930 [Peribacillus frigoritolerans]|uniref:hypothetical protein n=2 Tax=Peribacillus TaxID=2675229 RepID=UPI002E1B1C6D|nr:hypothetical protein [Peribacillus frigoritolerans]
MNQFQHGWFFCHAVFLALPLQIKENILVYYLLRAYLDGDVAVSQEEKRSLIRKQNGPLNSFMRGPFNVKKYKNVLKQVNSGPQFCP